MSPEGIPFYEERVCGLGEENLESFGLAGRRRGDVRGVVGATGEAECCKVKCIVVPLVFCLMCYLCSKLRKLWSCV